jgi:hypothetical protein
MSYKSDDNLGKQYSDIGSSHPSQSFRYPETVIKFPKFEFPKINYDYALPEYNYKKKEEIYYPNPYKFHDDSVSKFFIGSITVVGLFILYRILEKNK